MKMSLDGHASNCVQARAARLKARLSQRSWRFLPRRAFVRGCVSKAHAADVAAPHQSRAFANTGNFLSQGQVSVPPRRKANAESLDARARWRKPLRANQTAG